MLTETTAWDPSGGFLRERSPGLRCGGRRCPSARCTAARRARSAPRPGPWTAALLALLFAGTVLAEADGPDHYRVTGVAPNDVLHIRAEPRPDAPKLGSVPPDGTCLRNLGCRGGLTFEEFSTLSEAERAARLKANPRWCRVEYQGTVGWVAGRYLAEGACPP